MNEFLFAWMSVCQHDKNNVQNGPYQVLLSQVSVKDFEAPDVLQNRRKSKIGQQKLWSIYIEMIKFNKLIFYQTITQYNCKHGASHKILQDL